MVISAKFWEMVRVFPFVQRKEESLSIQEQEAMIYIMNMAKRPIKKQDLDGRKITLALLQDTKHIPGKSDVLEYNSMYFSQSQNQCNIWLSYLHLEHGILFLRSYQGSIYV